MGYQFTPERLAQGMSVQQFEQSMTKNQELFRKNSETAAIREEDVLFFTQLPHKITLVTIAEDWCGDVVAGLPVVQQLAQRAGAPEIKVFLRDQNTDIIDEYLKEGKYRSIPVFILLDEHLRELGYVIERSPKATAGLMEAAAAALQSDPSFAPDGTSAFEFDKMSENGKKAVSAALAQARALHGNEWNQELIHEFRQIIQKSFQL